MQGGERKSWLASVFAGNLALGAASMLIPLYALELGGGAFHLGVVAAASSIASIPALILWGKASDYFGKRKAFVVISYASSAFALALVPLAPSIAPLVLLAALFTSLAAGASPAVSMLAVEGKPKSTWARGVTELQVATSAGLAVGLLASAGLRLAMPLRSEFLLFAAVLAAAAILASATIREPRLTFERETFPILEPKVEVPFKTKVALPFVLHLPRLPSKPRLKLSLLDIASPLTFYLLVVFVIFFALNMFFSPLPAVMKALGITDAEVLALSAAPHIVAIAAHKLGEAAGNHPVRSLSLVVAARALLFTSMAGLYLASSTAGGHWAILAVFAGFFVAVGLTWIILITAVNVIVHRLTTDARRGAAVGAMNSTMGLAAFAGSLAGGAIASTLGYPAAAVSSGGVLLIAYFLSRKLPE